jgi:response regulator RpfG family c-di-GMP phosphodiesterase
MAELQKPISSDQIIRLPSILVVDDQPEICHVFSQLAGNQYHCIEASSGEAGLQALIDTDVDVVVSDLRMPGMDGIEFLQHAQIARPSAARILISGYSDAATVIEGINKGHILFFINKPFGK